MVSVPGIETEIMSKSAARRRRVADWLAKGRTQSLLIILILANAAVLGLESYPGIASQWGDALATLDRLLLGIFVIEIGMRLYAHGGRFFRDPWSVFDFVVIGIALVPDSGPFSVLRALRVLRVMRLISAVPSMRRVAAGLLSAIPGLGAVVGIISVILYVFSVMATKLFGERFPEWFGTLGESAYTLFQIMTLESWSMGIARPVMEAFPYAWLFFVVYILISTFTMLNLFIAVVVNAMQREQSAESQVDASEDLRALHAEIAALRADLSALRRAGGLDRERPGEDRMAGKASE